MRTARSICLVLVVLLSGLSGCRRSGSSAGPAPPPPGPATYPPQGSAPYPYPPSGSGPYPPPAASYPPGPPSPAPAVPQPGAIVPGNDPIRDVDMAWLRQQTMAIHRELVQALPNAERARVASIPLVFDPTPGEVNAFAACVDGKALMAVTDGMLDIAAHLAETQAIDEVFGTRKLDEYISLVAHNQRENAPVVRPPPGFLSPAQTMNASVVARAHQLFDELIAFVLGHELAHHHLGHLPCTGSPGLLGTAEIGRALSSAVPLFNQPNELAADVAGTQTVLSAGRAHRPPWTEGGALLTMRFFSGLDRLTPADIVFAFERTHPHPAVRTPVIQQTANAWRLTGGAWMPNLNLGG